MASLLSKQLSIALRDRAHANTQAINVLAAISSHDSKSPYTLDTLRGVHHGALQMLALADEFIGSVLFTRHEAANDDGHNTPSAA